MMVMDWSHHLSTYISPALMTGIAFWALGLYWVASPLAERLMEWLAQRLPMAVASVLSAIPFLLIAMAIGLGMQWYLGGSWSVSLGILACLGCGVFHLGRQDNNTTN